MIVKTFLYKIPPNLPLPKGGIIPLFGKEGPFDMAHGHELVEWRGEISEEDVWSIMDPLVYCKQAG